MNARFLPAMGCLLVLGTSCQTTNDTPAPTTAPLVVGRPTPLPGPAVVGTSFVFQRPANLPDLTANPAISRLTVEGIELGRQLFYDPQLSRDGTISCGTCHQQEAAFAHVGQALSHGIGRQTGSRNAQALQNLAWNRSFFWDGAVTSLDTFSMIPIENPVEMGLKRGEALDRVRRATRYPALFKAAYGTDSVTSARLTNALAQFMLTMVSANSRYDKFIRKEAGGELTTDELAGLTVFKAQCISCHSSDVFANTIPTNIGLPVDPKLNDQGRFAVTGLERDRLTFRTPTLRNVERTAPYMHDGRFNTLEQVLDHYTDGVQRSPTLHPVLQQNGRLGLVLSATDKKQLVDFMRTLTDNTFLTNPQFAAPR